MQIGSLCATCSVQRPPCVPPQAPPARTTTATIVLRMRSSDARDPYGALRGCCELRTLPRRRARPRGQRETRGRDVRRDVIEASAAQAARERATREARRMDVPSREPAAPRDDLQDRRLE